jgi:hypothetical protein
MSTGESEDTLDRTIVGEDGRILLFSCERFLSDICEGDACFICGASPADRPFNDEHIVPRWVLRRYQLFDEEITLPTGERRKYAGYRVPCCEECNSRLGREVETPVSRLLDGDYATVVGRLDDKGRELLFSWLALLFLKVHLKDRNIPIHKDRRLGTEVIGEAYDWADLHHIHAIARKPYTRANLLPEAIGSMQVFEVDEPLSEDGYDYLDFTFDQTIILRVGRIGIVATLNDATAAESAWSDRLDLIDGPINDLQLREIGAMFALANRNLIHRPAFSTYVVKRKWAFIAGQRAPLRLKDFEPEAFGHTLLFAVRNYVTARAIEVDGDRDPQHVSAAIASGSVRFLTKDGVFLPPVRKFAQAACDKTSDTSAID